MNKLINALKIGWDWCVKTFTGHSFVIAMPFAFFILQVAIPTRFLAVIAIFVWLFPLILGIHEDAK